MTHAADSLRAALKAYATLARVLDRVRDGLDTLADGVNSGALDPVTWHNETVQLLRVGYTAAYLDGRGDTTLSPGAQRLLARLVADQVGYLNGFLDQVEADGWSDARDRARLRMYGASVRQAYERGATFGLPLPTVPGAGSTRCLTNCKCRLRIRWLDEEELDADVFWMLGKAEHCPDCVTLSKQWAPLRIRGGEVARSTVKHGNHNQASHGRKGRGGQASRAAYQKARAGGATPTEARQQARDVMDTYRARQRIANIDKQLDGRVSEGQRASLLAERERHQADIITRANRTPQAGQFRQNEFAATVQGRGQQAKPTAKPAKGRQGDESRAYGADPNQHYTLQHRLVDMDEIQASNTATGAINERYDPRLQPRDRSRAASQAQAKAQEAHKCQGLSSPRSSPRCSPSSPAK